MDAWSNNHLECKDEIKQKLYEKPITQATVKAAFNNVRMFAYFSHEIVWNTEIEYWRPLAGMCKLKLYNIDGKWATAVLRWDPEKQIKSTPKTSLKDTKKIKELEERVAALEKLVTKLMAEKVA